jgi:hypothetical protein
MSADAELDRASNEAAARDKFVDERYFHYKHMLLQRPLGAQVSSQYKTGAPLVGIGADLVDWVQETFDDPEQAIAEAVFYDYAKLKLIEQYCEARAQADADRQPGSTWIDAASAAFESAL